MARTKQRLINYNTSGATNVPVHSDLQHGEIAVRYNEENPALFIKDNNNNIVTFIASGAISTAIENAQENVSSLSAAVGTFSGAVDTYKTTTDGRLDNLEASAHTHENKSVLDGISAGQITGWDLASAQTHTHSNKALLDTYTQTESDLADAVLKKHEHTNMDVLTALTAEEVAKWNASAHNHSNKDVLDGITSDKVTAWDNAVNSAITGVTVNNEPATISSHVAEITISTATTTTNGLMSAADKTRLDGIESGAQVNVIESVKVDGTALTVTNKAVDIPLTGYAQAIEYDSSAKTINLKNSKGETLDTVNATDFIKDGMVSNVEISGNNLVITFNSDAGHEDISIPLTSIFDPNNYYNKTETDAQISAATAAASAASVNSAKTYTDEVSGSIATLVYTKADKTEVTTLSGNVVTELNKKVDKIEGKQLSTEDYTTAEKEKLGSIAASAQVNTIEIVKVNGTALTPDSDKAVDVIIPAAGTLDTTVATALTPSATESFSGTVQLHKVAKTGTYNDLIGTPTKVSDFSNDLEFVSNSTLTGTYATSANVQTALDGKVDNDTFNTVSGIVEDNKNDIAELSGSVFDNYFTLASATTALGTKADLDEFKAVSGVVETNSGNIYTLSGEVVTNYITSASVYNALSSATSNVSDLSGSVETLSATVVSGYATSASVQVALDDKVDDTDFQTVSGVVETNSGNIYTLSGEVVSHYATSSDTYNAIDAVDDKVEALSGATPKDFVFTTISDADGNHTQSGAKSKYDTTSQAMQLDLTNLVIDCGTF